MPATLDTRKPVDALQPDDLAAFPIWEFVMDEDNEEADETWVRPLDGDCIGQDEYSLSVAADFRTASGLEIPGLMGVSTADGFEFEHGALLHQGSYVFVPAPDFDDMQAEHTAVAAGLGMTLSDVFPLAFTLRVRVEGETDYRSGRIE